MQRNRVAVEAPAKVNLHLDITGTAPNGYHTLDTVFQAVSLSDLVIVGRNAAPGIRVTCSRPGVPEDGANLAHRAAAALLSEAGVEPGGLHIHIDKAIPAEAGLGGGSSDAAAVLVGLDRLLGLGFSPERLCGIGLRVGADVPFLIRGGCALAGGVGERLSSLYPGLRPCSLVIAKPSEGIGTAEAYTAYDAHAGICHQPSEGMQTAIAAGNLELVAKRLFNVFEQVIHSAGTNRIRSAMAESGALGSLLSGTGSAVFGIFSDETAAGRCLAMLSGEAFLAEPVQFGAKIVYAG